MLTNSQHMDDDLSQVSSGEAPRTPSLLSQCNTVDSSEDEEWSVELVGQIKNLVASAIDATAVALMEYAGPLYDKVPYYTSILSGHAWVKELLSGHPKRIRCELGVHKRVFWELINNLEELSLGASGHVTLKEQLAIFLYTCVTGLSIQHVGERFQRSNDTISKFFMKILLTFSSPSFYAKNVYIPEANSPVPKYIQKNSDFFPFFKDAIGAIDGTHISCTPSASEHVASTNRRGAFTRNCLAACTFDMRFVYLSSGWDSGAVDSTMHHETQSKDFRIPPGRFYLADGIFNTCDGLMSPYRGVCYDLLEWDRVELV